MTDTARSITEAKRGLVVADGASVAFTPDVTDEEAVRLARDVYGWNDVVVERDEAIVRVRPKGEDDE